MPLSVEVLPSVDTWYIDNYFIVIIAYKCHITLDVSCDKDYKTGFNFECHPWNKSVMANIYCTMVNCFASLVLHIVINSVLQTTLNIIGSFALPAKLFNWNFNPREVVSRWRDPPLQVSGNCSDLTKWRSRILKSCWLMSRFVIIMFKCWYLMCQWKKKRNGNRDWRLNGSRDVSDTYKVTFPLFNCNEYLVLIIIVCLSFHPIGLLIYLMKCLRFVLISFTSK